MKGGGIKKSDGFSGSWNNTKVTLKIFLGFFFCVSFVTAKRNWNLNVSSVCLPC